MKTLLSSSVALFAATLASAAAAAGAYKPPRLADGTPDLQGVWTNATATPIERSPQLGNRRAFTPEEAAAVEKAARDRVAADAAPSDPNAKQEAAASLPPVGNYNLFWTDRGMTAALIDGEYRTSVIVDPPNGRIPPLTETGKQRRGGRERELLEEGAANGAVPTGPADGPEQRGLGERCLLSFGSSSGPPMLPTMYNSYYQFVQSPGYVTILVEMVHDARIIRLSDKHVPKSVKKWMGDSIGRWEGDTLVVETTNFNPQQSYRGSSENMKVTERFTRVADDKIVYQFTVEDPTTFSSAFTGELAFTPAGANIYEYACHEGNYALSGILSGARELEKQPAPAATKKSE
jgi:hypothetical protein